MRTRTPTAGLLLRDLDLPDFRSYAVEVDKPATTFSEATKVLGSFLRDILSLNEETRNFRVFGPDETASNRLSAVFEVDDRELNATILPTDDHLSPDGRVMEVLSEHMCQGWLEGYLLTGRHGLFNCYEAFIHIVDSMFNQHAKWLKTTRRIPWRRPIASLNYLLSSHVWRQDHNGLSHQDPGFIDHVMNKKAEIIRVYLPPDANTLLSVADHCLRSRNYVNVIVAGKQPALNYLSMDDAIAHCTRGIGIWEWASNDCSDTGVGEPDLVMACAGDVPTLEALAATALVREYFPNLSVRFVNVVDLMRLQPDTEHPHGMSDRRVRPALHDRQAGGVRLSRLSLADPPADLSADQSRQHPRAGLQRRRDDDNAVRHGDDERPRPLPPRDGRHRPRPVAARECGACSAANGRRTAAQEAIHPRVRRRRTRRQELDLALLMRILVVNAGSSSLKLRLLGPDDSLEASWDALPATLPDADVVVAPRRSWWYRISTRRDYR